MNKSITAKPGRDALNVRAEAAGQRAEALEVTLQNLRSYALNARLTELNAHDASGPMSDVVLASPDGADTHSVRAAFHELSRAVLSATNDLGMARSERGPDEHHVILELRLPRFIHAMVLKMSEQRQEHIDGLVRRAIATYNVTTRGDHSLIPTTQDVRDQLDRVAEHRRMPTITLAEELLATAARTEEQTTFPAAAKETP